ncbi:MAG: mycothiol system anti-sigma-R factor [Actinobacteria bacterium]|nr:MAG: mycothiol system anti-sigma-R factor [Actinomycetota bacterium]
MIDCEHVLREIELFLDRELDATESKHIQEHLAECGGCLERKEFRVTLRKIVAKKCGPSAAPEELVSRIRALLSDESS